MTIDEQIANLKAIGLQIDNEDYARRILGDISYFRLIKTFSLNLKEFYTTIDANLLVESSLEKPIRLFIFFKNKDMAEVYVNVTAFPEDKRDFTKYQTQWTLLCAQKKSISSGEVVELFRAKSFSE